MRSIQETDSVSRIPEASTTRSSPGDAGRSGSLPPPDLAEGPHCPACGVGPLVISGVSQLHFSCPRAHVYFLSDLLAAQREEVMADLERLLASWNEKAVLLAQVANDARVYGYEAVAVTFECQAKTLERRVELLRRGLGAVAS